LPGRDDASPQTVSVAEGAAGAWPLAAVAHRGEVQIVEDLVARFGELETGHWPAPPRQAVVLPLREAGQAQLAGIAVFGVSPYRALDHDYLSFLSLATGHIATAVSNAQAYESERRRAEALAEIDRAKTAFFSNVSHEFRTPLTLMLGPLESVLATGALAPGEREQLATAHRNSLRLLKLVNSLLDFSRIEAGRIKAAFTPTDLASLTTDLASNFRSAMEAAGLKLIVDCPSLSQPVYVDRDMWEKIVLNLLSNAFKFTLEGSVTVHLREQEGKAVLTIADTGTGIPASELPHIFERFHRVGKRPGPHV
jgi:signal transduction histidine kinase